MAWHGLRNQVFRNPITIIDNAGYVYQEDAGSSIIIAWNAVEIK
jgi:hypothetical protein